MNHLQQLELVVNTWDPVEQTNNLISVGSYAGVFDSDQPGMVIKRVRETMRDAYILYALYAMEFHNKYPLLPKISAAVIDKNGQSFFMMEKLDKVDDGLPYITGNIERNIFYIQNRILDSVYMNATDKIAFLKMLTEMHLWFVNVEENFPFFLDAHHDNWMYRKNQLVLTDPFTYIGGDCHISFFHGVDSRTYQRSREFSEKRQAREFLTFTVD